MSCTDLISLIANICTIAAFAVAVYVLAIWKKQQNYSFERDKIFELELAADQLFKESIYYIITIRDLIESRSRGNSDKDFFEKELRLRLTNWQACLKQYDLKLSSLNVLLINFDKEILESAVKIGKYFDDIVDKMYAESNPQKAVNDFDAIYLQQANIARNLVLKHLREIREKI